MAKKTVTKALKIGKVIDHKIETWEDVAEFMRQPTGGEFTPDLMIRHDPPSPPTGPTPKAKLLVWTVLEGLLELKGFDDWWDDLDDRRQREIKKELAILVQEVLSK